MNEKGGFAMYYQRDIEDYIKETGKYFESIVVYGARQVGKSTVIEHIFEKDFAYVTLDDTDQLELALAKPKLFLESHPWPLIIDEVQKAPKLLNEIKIKIDEERKRKLKENLPRELMYILTGSNRFKLQEGISESLAGRVAVIEMGSFTQIETIQKKGKLFHPDIKALLETERNSTIPYASQAEIFNRIFLGGMPDIIVNKTPRETYFKSYFDTYIEKDLRNLIDASSEMTFRRFVSYLALRTAQQVNYEVFAREVGIDSATCRRWISILQTSGIIILLEPYMASISKRIIKAPKLYFMDTGLCAYLCKWPSAEMLQDCAMNGAFFETFVVSEMIKSFYNHGKEYENTLFYYRDIDQKEVDILYVEANSIYPIEIKKGISPTKPNKNFNVLNKYGLEIKPGLVINCSDKITQINEKAYYFPVYLLGA